MRIERIQVASFGRLHELDSGAAPLENLVVVLGPNEAGKSTLFHFLTTALYGFQPASRERSPHVPWGGDEAGGTVHVRLANGQCASVERKLRSQPSGLLVVEGVEHEVRNQPLPWVEHVPRTVFRQVFAVTLADLAGLDDETWARIQDRMVGSMGATDLRPARAVAEALEREAGELWRPNRRGRQRIRETQQGIRDLRERRRGAIERDRDIRDLLEQKEVALRELDSRRAERREERVAMKRIEDLHPIWAQLRRIAALREQGGPPEALSGFPAKPAARFAELEATLKRLRERLRALSAERREPEAAIAALDARTTLLLASRARIEAYLAEAAVTAGERAAAQGLEGDVHTLDARITSTARSLLTEFWGDGLDESVASIDLPELRRRVQAFERAPLPDVGVATRSGTDGQAGAWLGVGLLLVGVPMLGWGLWDGGTPAVAIGTALCASGATLWALRARGDASARGGRLGGRADRSREAWSQEPDREAARRSVLEILDPLPLRAELRDEPGPELCVGLEKLQELVLDRRERVVALDAVRARVAAADAAGRELAASVGVDPAARTEALAALLDARLRGAERVAQAATAADRDVRRIDEEAGALRRELLDVERRHLALVTAAERIGGGDVERGLALAAARIDAHDLADRLDEELRRAQPDLATLRDRIAGMERSGELQDGEALERSRLRIDELDRDIEELVALAESLERKVEHARDLETVDAVDGEIASLREEEERLIRERDRKWLLAALIREADRRFREEHQPDLMRRASGYLRRLTGGRYDRLIADETSAGDLFQVMGPDLPAPIPLADPVSTGTLEQAYLGLRLAIVDHLDQAGERLPLFVDEVFVNWDRERRDRGLEVLRELSCVRQLFVFTCHPDVADGLAALGGRVLRLGSGG